MAKTILQNTMKNKLIYLIATSQNEISRTELATLTGLSKMTIGNYINELIQEGILIEEPYEFSTKHTPGRRPVALHISPSSPCIMGTYIGRTYCQSILADISGKAINTIRTYYDNTLSQEDLVEYIKKQFNKLTSHTSRPLLGYGVCSPGPIDKTSGTILNPPNFFNLSDIPIVSILEEYTKLPVRLIQDVDAGALVERLYGYGKKFNNFIYLHIIHGIGMSVILNGELFSEISGHSSEIGHMSINFNGPKCACGNVGCLEQYASLEQMKKRIRELLTLFKDSLFHKATDITQLTIIDFADRGDPIAITVLDEFCSYLSHALGTTLKFLDFSTLIIGYESHADSNLIEKILYTKLKPLFATTPNKLKIFHSYFNGDAPLLGTIATITNEFFIQNEKI